MSILLFGIAPVPVMAENIPVQVQEDTSLFGHLNQQAVNIGASCTAFDSCAIFAAINSFVFLQDRYPEIYGNTLVPDKTGAGITKVAQTLAQFMDCKCGPGVRFNNFFAGKEKFFSTEAATTIITQSAYNSDGSRRKSGAPKMNFLMRELSDDEDVEVLIGAYQSTDNGKTYKRLTGHYLTVTGGIVNDTNANGKFDKGDTPASLSFINPNGVQNKGNLNGGYDITTSVAEMETEPFGTVLQLTNYFSATQKIVCGNTPIEKCDNIIHKDWNDQNTFIFIDGAVSESPFVPAPEPFSWLLLATGAAGIVFTRISLRRSPN